MLWRSSSFFRPSSSAGLHCRNWRMSQACHSLRGAMLSANKFYSAHVTAIDRLLLTMCSQISVLSVQHDNSCNATHDCDGKCACHATQTMAPPLSAPPSVCLEPPSLLLAPSSSSAPPPTPATTLVSQSTLPVTFN